MEAPPQSVSNSLLKNLKPDPFLLSLIGAYIVWWRAEESRLGAVFLHPAVQGQGIGQRLWRHIEQTYPAKSWVLDTPTWAVRCHHFYERCGFTRAGASGDQVVFRKRLATT